MRIDIHSRDSLGNVAGSSSVSIVPDDLDSDFWKIVIVFEFDSGMAGDEIIIRGLTRSDLKEFHEDFVDSFNLAFSREL